MEEENFEKTKYWVELAKWFIVSVAFVLVSMIIDWKFKSRDKSLDEVKFYSDKYLTELIILNDNVGPRYKLAQFFKCVTVDNDQREGWVRYFEEVKIDFDNLNKKDSLYKIDQIKILENDSSQWDEKQKLQFKLLQNRINKVDIALNSELKLPNQSPSKFYIIISGDNTLEEAEYERIKFNNYETKIILRNGAYRTVIEFDSIESANKSLNNIKSMKSDAYLVDATKWCPNLLPQENHFVCN
ncbi:hypothetical protein [uncultured Cyclobacterium sp.]|uniref:hypothetical protein n=1 Tax=uncultured Cyclobacterium sp. TaxID=453820 RepID=UPI0030EC9509|tara:strand:+ start:46761 stop:47486 length:726 start_codon:yes stop_codon:yes gene_type:complete